MMKQSRAHATTTRRKGTMAGTLFNQPNQAAMAMRETQTMDGVRLANERRLLAIAN
jgi:hypothetical protein